MLRSKHRTMISESVIQFFQGNIFRARMECESFVECADGIVKSVGQVKNQKQNYKFNIDGLTRFSVTNRFGTTFVSENEIIRVDEFQAATKIDISGLLSNCSDTDIIEDYFVAICLHNDGSNYFRFMKTSDNFNWFDIRIQLPSTRSIKVSEIILQVRETYVTVLTYNIFFKRYLTVFVFKWVKLDPDLALQMSASRSSNFNSKHPQRLYFNPIAPQFGLLLSFGLANTFRHRQASGVGAIEYKLLLIHKTCL